MTIGNLNKLFNACIFMFAARRGTQMSNTPGIPDCRKQSVLQLLN
jgi:hypothetical protein